MGRQERPHITNSKAEQHKKRASGPTPVPLPESRVRVTVCLPLPRADASSPHITSLELPPHPVLSGLGAQQTKGPPAHPHTRKDSAIPSHSSSRMTSPIGKGTSPLFYTFTGIFKSFCGVQMLCLQYPGILQYLLREGLGRVPTESRVCSMTPSPSPTDFSLVLKLHSSRCP